MAAIELDNMTGFEYICNKFHMSYAEIARQLNISRQAVSKWSHSGKVPATQATKLSKILQIPVGYFLLEQITHQHKDDIEFLMLRSN